MRRFKWYVWVIVGVVAIAVVYGVVRKRRAGDAMPEYRTAIVERTDIVVSVVAVGALEPLTTVDVKANVAGEITELAVDRGDRVMMGDLIAAIDPTETRSAFDQAEADVRSAQARVREAETDLTRQRELAPAQVNVASKSATTADARTMQAESSLEYQRRITESDIIRSQQAVEAAKARLRQAEARAKTQPILTSAAIRQAEAELRTTEQSAQRLRDATHPQENASVRAQLSAARISVENQRKTLERRRRLRARGAVSQQELEDGETAFADSQDRYETAQATSDTLAEKQGSELEEAAARVRQATAGLEAAQANEVEIGISQQELAATRAALRESEAGLASAIAGRAQDDVSLQELRAARAGADEARSQVSIARANARQAQASAHQLSQAQAQTSRSEAQLDNARKNLGYTTITAPRDGLVIDRYVEEGTVITSGRSSVVAGTNIVTLADVSRMFLLAEVDEADIGQVKAGQAVEIEVETFPDTPFNGKVVQVYPRGENVDNVTVFKVRVELLKPAKELSPGMTAEASIICQRAKDVLAAPNDAVYEQEGKQLAEVLKEAESEVVEVETGISNFELTEIREGLKEGDEVVLGAGGGGFGPPGMGGGGGGGRSQRGMMRMGGGGRR